MQDRTATTHTLWVRSPGPMGSSKSKGTRALRARIDPLSAAEGLMGGQRPRGEGYGAQSEAAHRPKRGVWEDHWRVLNDTFQGGGHSPVWGNAAGLASFHSNNRRSFVVRRRQQKHREMKKW